MNRPVTTAVVLSALVGYAAPASGQARPVDVASPEAIVAATYEAIARAPGDDYDWDRFRTLFLPQANLIPSVEQTSGRLTVMSVEDFVRWIASTTVIGGAATRASARTASTT